MPFSHFSPQPHSNAPDGEAVSGQGVGHARTVANSAANPRSGQTLASLTLGDGATATMVPDTFRLLSLNSLDMSGYSSLQLKAGNLVLGGGMRRGRS